MSEAATPPIFINYHAHKDKWAAALLDRELSDLFGEEAVFRAGRSILSGRDYEVVLRNAVADAAIMLVLMGGSWGEDFKYRGSESWTLHEIQLAQQQKSVVLVPVWLERMEKPHRPWKNWPKAIDPKLGRSRPLFFTHRAPRFEAQDLATELLRIPTLPKQLGKTTLKRLAKLGLTPNSNKISVAEFASNALEAK